MRNYILVTEFTQSHRTFADVVTANTERAAVNKLYPSTGKSLKLQPSAEEVFVYKCSYMTVSVYRAGMVCFDEVG